VVLFPSHWSPVRTLVSNFPHILIWSGWVFSVAVLYHFYLWDAPVMSWGVGRKRSSERGHSDWIQGIRNLWISCYCHLLHFTFYCWGSPIDSLWFWPPWGGRINRDRSVTVAWFHDLFVLFSQLPMVITCLCCIATHWSWQDNANKSVTHVTAPFDQSSRSWVLVNGSKFDPSLFSVAPKPEF
jgi:hypothetical protein